MDVSVPEPPTLTSRRTESEFAEVEDAGSEADLRRSELDTALRDGAWREAFEEWSTYTDLTEADVGVVSDLGLFQEFDVYWDSSDERLRWVAPQIPEDVVEDRRDAAEGIDVSDVHDALDDLGRAVVETIADGYLDWNEGELEDYVWDEPTFGEGIDRED